jgi:hypothetical protein
MLPSHHNLPDVVDFYLRIFPFSRGIGIRNFQRIFEESEAVRMSDTKASKMSSSSSSSKRQKVVTSKKKSTSLSPRARSGRLSNDKDTLGSDESNDEEEGDDTGVATGKGRSTSSRSGRSRIGGSSSSSGNARQAYDAMVGTSIAEVDSLYGPRREVKAEYSVADIQALMNSIVDPIGKVGPPYCVEMFKRLGPACMYYCLLACANACH